MDEKIKIDSLEILSEMNKVSKITNMMNNRFYQKIKLTRVQFKALCLLCVADDKGHSLSEISENLNITKPSASALIDRMVTASLVTRASNKEDRRGIRILITSYGEERLKEALKITEDLKKKRLNFLTEEEKSTLYKLLLKIKENMIKDLEE